MCTFAGEPGQGYGEGQRRGGDGQDQAEEFIVRRARLPTPPDLARLTDRGREVLRLLASRRSNTELADELYVGEGTIKTHVSNVLSKLGLRDRVQAVVFAYETGLVSPGA